MQMMANKNIKSDIIISTWNMDGNARTNESTSMVNPSNLDSSLNGLNALNALNALKDERDMVGLSSVSELGLIFVYKSTQLTITIRKSIWLLKDMN